MFRGSGEPIDILLSRWHRLEARFGKVMPWITGEGDAYVLRLEEGGLLVTLTGPQVDALLAHPEGAITG